MQAPWRCKPNSLRRADGTLHHRSVQPSVDFDGQGCAMKDTQEVVPPRKWLSSVQDSKRPHGCLDKREGLDITRPGDHQVSVQPGSSCSVHRDEGTRELDSE